MGEKFKKCIKFGGGGEKQEGEGKRLTVIYLKGLDENAQVSFLKDFMQRKSAKVVVHCQWCVVPHQQFWKECQLDNPLELC